MLSLLAACSSTAEPKLGALSVQVSGSVIEAGAVCLYSLTVDGHVWQGSIPGDSLPMTADTTLSLAEGSHHIHDQLTTESPSRGNRVVADDFTATVPGSVIVTCPIP